MNISIQSRKTIAQIILLLVMFFTDGITKLFFSGFFNYGRVNIVPQFLLATLVIMAFRMDDGNRLFFYALIFGLFYDTYYLGLVGIYTFLFPLITTFVFGIKEFLPASILYEGSVYLISLTLVQIIIYLLGLLFKFANLNFSDFVTFNLAPTLFFNMLMFLILYFIMSNVIDWVLDVRGE